MKTTEDSRKKLTAKRLQTIWEVLEARHSGLQAKQLIDHIAALEAELATLEQDAEEVRLLREMADRPPWYYCDDPGFDICFYCQCYSDDPHKPDCPYGKLQNVVYP